jgi:putative ATPase
MTAPEAPLADRMRPRSLDEVLGQEHLAGPGGLLRQLGEGALPSVIFQGPPGTGKTTLARIFASGTGARFEQLSAVLSGVADLRKSVERAHLARTGLEQRATVLFVDEIHRWNKAQQDALLPHVEAGTITLLGATTENPGFYVIPALRSRCRIVRLEPLQAEQVQRLIERSLTDRERGLGALELQIEPPALEALARAADGDARRALTLLEDVARRVEAGSTLDLETLARLVEAAELRHDRDGDAHYDVLSAFIKSMRGSDPDASIYWLARLLAGGEPPEAIARRVVILAAEDVGNADPRALQLAVAAAQAVQLTGMPEARIPLAQAVTYCATAPKSNAAYKAIDAALDRVKATGALPVPLHLRNAPTKLAKEAGHGAGYRYPHDHPHHVVRQDYRPPAVADDVYYRPAPHGTEKTIAERLAWWSQQLDRDPTNPTGGQF